jgi:hypothetical protein
MTIRILDAAASQFVAMNAFDLAESIRKGEGRAISVEVNCADRPPVDGVTHAELAAAFGADIILLDQYNPPSPFIPGSPDSVMQSTAPLNSLKTLIGRPVGINLLVGRSLPAEKAGRAFTPVVAQAACDQGADIFFIINQPSYGGTLEQMCSAAEWVDARLDGRVMTVAVISASAPPPRTSLEIAAFADTLKPLLQAGYMGIGLPMPGSKQGWTPEAAAQLIDCIHSGGGLAWAIITGSVEGSPREAMINMALQAKMLGFDVHRLDDAGLSGMPSPENIFTYSLAIRGERHTYRRMALSVRR